jgi:hypothetical protein
MSILKPALVYFALVFGTGFLLGTIRVLVLEPVVGERTAELMEMPIMLAVVFLAARFTVSKWGRTRKVALAFGLLALLLMILSEIGVVAVLLIGASESTSLSIEGRDPVTSTVYAISLLIFGLLPYLLYPKWRRA